MAETMSSKRKWISPFLDRVTLSKHDEFDQYYLDVSYKEVYRKAGIDDNGEEFGVIDVKPIVKKKSIKEVLDVEAKSVGIEAYMRALAVQGDSLENYNTLVDDGVIDYSNMPDNLADVLTAGDKAKSAFANLDPALKGNHTTIEGFLNSLSKETIDNYIKGKVDAAFPKEVNTGGE